MDYKLNENCLCLFFEGEINSANALEKEKEIDLVISNNSFFSLILDFDKLNYISSAGLRIILKLKQKYQNVSVINVNPEVYEILDMTGFSTIMDVKRALKEISVEGAKVIGNGFFSTVYRLDQDTIIKVFNRTSDENQIERELKLAKEAFILGVPTAISYDIVKVNDKLGVRFEMLDCMSLRDAFRDYPDRYDELLDRYVRLLKTINSTECFNDEVPDIKKFFIKKVEDIKEYLDIDHYNKLHKLIESVKDSNNFVHGDCHFKNIMVQGDEFLLIDMDTLSKGHFIFELASLRAPYVAFEEDSKGNSLAFLGMDSAFVSKLFYDLLDKYFDGVTEAQKDKIALVCYLHMVWWNRVNEPGNMIRFEGCKERLIKLLDEYDDLEV